MKIVNHEVSLEWITPAAKFVIERAGRTCYKSEDKAGINPGAFIQRIIASGHHSVLEHASASFRIITDRGVTHEIVRHRIASYSQESTRYCVAGDTKLTTSNPHNRPTVRELFDNKSNSTNGAWRRIQIRQIDEVTGLLKFEKIRDIVETGVRETIRLTTRLGYKIELTKDHPVKSESGYVDAGKLNIGDKICVNGTDLLYKNRDWLFNQNATLGKNFVQIGREFGFGVSVLKSWARKHGLPKFGPGRHNVGRVPWNKGLSESDDTRVAAQGAALREHHWNGGNSTATPPKRDRVKKQTIRTYGKLVGETCEICGSGENLHVHHIDEDRSNNVSENLITLCSSHHGRIHAKNLEVGYYDSIVSIESCGEQTVYDIEMASENHNFVANGIVVHNCNYTGGRFDGQLSFIRPVDLPESLWQLWEKRMESVEADYKTFIASGARPQEARSILPNCVKTEIVMTANFREWRHFIELRTAPAAHPDMRVVAKMIATMLSQLEPEVFADLLEETK